MWFSISSRHGLSLFFPPKLVIFCLCLFDCWHCDLGGRDGGFSVFRSGWVYGTRDLSLALGCKLHGCVGGKGDGLR